MAEEQNLSNLPAVYDRVTSSTETTEELQHRLFLEKARFFANAFGVLLVFLLLTAILFFQEDLELRKSAQVMLQALAAGFIGYIAKR